MNLSERIQTRENSTERLQQIAHDVAYHLTAEDGQKWSSNLKHAHFVEFASAAGERLYLSTQGQPGRFNASGSIDLSNHLGEKVELPYKAFIPNITLSADREPKAIAREFCRRVLPGYRELLALCKESQQKSNEYHSQAASVGERLASVVGGTFNPQRGEVDLYRSTSLPEMSGDVKVYADSVGLKLSVSPAEAEAMLRALVEVRKASGKQS